MYPPGRHEEHHRGQDGREDDAKQMAHNRHTPYDISPVPHTAAYGGVRPRVT